MSHNGRTLAARQNGGPALTKVAAVAPDFVAAWISDDRFVNCGIGLAPLTSNLVQPQRKNKTVGLVVCGGAAADGN
jgi:acyl CoA:acetate/3-ketoacid CoA transferase beta subunit